MVTEAHAPFIQLLGSHEVLVNVECNVTRSCVDILIADIADVLEMAAS